MRVAQSEESFQSTSGVDVYIIGRIYKQRERKLLPRSANRVIASTVEMLSEMVQL